jgi:hypothetical protein
MLVFHLDMLAAGATPFGEGEDALADARDRLETGFVLRHYFEINLRRPRS